MVRNAPTSFSALQHVFPAARTTQLPHDILQDPCKLGVSPTNLERKLEPILIKMRGSTEDGMSVPDACLYEKLVKIVNFRQPIRPLVGRDEIRVCVNVCA